MKSTGIIRRVDDLGRAVIPKEIRKKMQVREGDPLEFFMGEDNSLILKKYQPLGELASDETISVFMRGAAEAFGVDVVVADKEGRVLQSTIRHLQDMRLEDRAGAFCDGASQAEDVKELQAGTYVRSDVCGASLIKRHDNSYVEGAVFVLGDSVCGNQIAQTLAAVVAQRYEYY